MKNPSLIERLLQASVILACLVILVSDFSEDSNAQGCNGRPPLTPPLGYETAWYQYKNIAIKIFDRTNAQPTSPEEFNALDAAIRDWNNIKITGCSNVTFGSASRAGRAYVSSEDRIPDDTVFVIRTTERSGQYSGVYAGTHMRAGLVYLHSDYDLNTPDPHFRIDNLPKHEIGHSFGVANGTNSAPRP